MSVPKAAAELVKKVKTAMQKAKNISKSLCKNCQNDDDEDDYYFDDDDDEDDDFYRFKRNVEAESPEGTVEGLVGLVQNINSRVVDRTKTLANAGLDAAREAVKVAFGMVSGGLNSSETGSEDSAFDNSSQMVQKIGRSIMIDIISLIPRQIRGWLAVILMDCEAIASKLYHSFSSQVKTIFATLREMFNIIWHTIFNNALDRKARALDSVAQFNSSLDQSLNTVKKVILDVTQKMKGQVLKSLQEMSRFVQGYKSRLERGRRSLEGVKSIWKRQAETDASEQPSSTISNPQPPSGSPTSKTSDHPSTTTPNPVAKGLNELTNLTESVSEILDVVFDLTDIFSLRRKRDVDGEETESETSLSVFIEDIENGTLEVLANTKELIGRTIHELGQNIDLGLQRISSALSRQRRSAEEQLEDIKMFLRELPKAISTQLKNWFEEAILLKRELFQNNGNGQEILRAIKLDIDLLKKWIEDFLAGSFPPMLEEPEDTSESEAELEGEKIVSRERRFVLMDTLVGMLVAKATSTVTDWMYETANYLTSDYGNPQTEEEDLNTNNRIKRESDKSLLTEIIQLPGRVLEGIIERGRKRADAIRKVITGQETEENLDEVYPGRR